MSSIREYGNHTESPADVRTRVVVARGRAGWGEWLARESRRVITDRRVHVGAALVLALLVGIFASAWMSASRLVDSHLVDGRVDTTSGVYAAPLAVRAGQPLSRDDLVAYLTHLGYTTGEQEGTGFAGRYTVEEDAVTVEPLDPAVLATGRYAPMRIEFSGKQGVARVLDPKTKKPIKEGRLQPIMISSAFSHRQKRTPITYDAIPESLRKAIITTEDRRFWSHHGVDYRGIARAVRENFDEGDVVQGGSTITQQVVKNVFLTPERSVERKVREAFLSYVLEWKLSKEEIFTLYVNEVYLGQSGTYAVHGFAEAANRFFGKDVGTLTLEESALLAGIIRAPNSNSPYRHPDRAKARRDLVLDMMAETGAIAAEEAEEAKARPIQVVPPQRDSEWIDAPYYNDYIREYMEEVIGDLGSASGRFKVDTTIDINLQRAATEAVRDYLGKLDAVLAKGKNGVPPGTVQAALVALDAKTGAVLAMVGGRDYSQSQLNRATDAMRQPGSVFKPFVYATAISSRRYTPATPVMDAPQKFTYAGRQTYEPSNYGQAYANKEIPVRTALRYSKNVPTVEIAINTGLGSIAATAERAGLPRPDPYPAMALGTFEATPLQVAEAYTSFVNGGNAIEPTPIAATERGDAVSVRRTKSRAVFSPQVAYVMTDMLEDVVNGGTGAAVRARGVKGAVAGKTGTSRDGWFAGYTPNMVCVVWVGFDDGSQLGLTGAESALPIWAEFVKKTVAFRPELGGESFPKPSGILMAKVCDVSGRAAGEFCPATHEEIFVSGSEPSGTCYIHTGHVADALVPLFDEDGSFIGYGSPSDSQIKLPDYSADSYRIEIEREPVRRADDWRDARSEEYDEEEDEEPRRPSRREREPERDSRAERDRYAESPYASDRTGRGARPRRAVPPPPGMIAPPPPSEPPETRRERPRRERSTFSRDEE